MTDNQIAAVIAQSTVAHARAYMMTTTHTEAQNAFVFHILDAVHNVPGWIADDRPALDLLLENANHRPHDARLWILNLYAEVKAVA